jgi:hypothetical protein
MDGFHNFKIMVSLNRRLRLEISHSKIFRLFLRNHCPASYLVASQLPPPCILGESFSFLFCIRLPLTESEECKKRKVMQPLWKVLYEGAGSNKKEIFPCTPPPFTPDLHPPYGVNEGFITHPPPWGGAGHKNPITFLVPPPEDFASLFFSAMRYKAPPKGKP